MIRDVLSEAWRPGVAEPIAIHIHPGLRTLLPWPVERSRGPGPRVPLVVDEGIPAVPGYEIHRAPPPHATAAP